MLLLIIDIGIAVKKIVAILQKYALPESTCSLLPFLDETARAAQISAIVPARLCIVIIIFTLILTFAIMFTKVTLQTENVYLVNIYLYSDVI